jgi:tRNA-dihydrouridine synthase
LSLIEAVVAVARVPVTLKMRLGWCGASMNAHDIAKRAESAGVSMIVVHGRTRQQFYRGKADWTAIGETVRAVSIPVIANGDITSASDAREALKQSGAAGIMIGRAAQGRPWLPAAIETALKTSGDEIAPPRADVGASLLALYDDALEFYGLEHGARIARKHIASTIAAEFPELTNDVQRALRERLFVLTPARLRTEIVALFDQQESLAA